MESIIWPSLVWMMLCLDLNVACFGLILYIRGYLLAMNYGLFTQVEVESNVPLSMSVMMLCHVMCIKNARG